MSKNITILVILILLVKCFHSIFARGHMLKIKSRNFLVSSFVFVLYFLSISFQLWTCFTHQFSNSGIRATDCIFWSRDTVHIHDIVHVYSIIHVYDTVHVKQWEPILAKLGFGEKQRQQNMKLRNSTEIIFRYGK